MQPDRRLYRLSPMAERDLEDIWDYSVRTWSPEQAERYQADIITAIEGLALGDRAGRYVGEIRSGYFRYAVRRHLLFYKVTPDYLDIVRILHERMDISARLQHEN